MDYQLKRRYEQACQEYVFLFCEKQGMDFDGWVADEVGGIAVCADFYFNLHDIKLDVDKDVEAGVICGWYYDNLESGKPPINYTSYLMGLRQSDIW